MRWVAAALLALVPQVALALACGPRAEMINVLAGKYGEQPVSVATSGPNAVQVYANLQSGSWTVVMFMAARPDVACVIAGGEDFDLLPIEKGEKS